MQKRLRDGLFCKESQRSASSTQRQQRARISHYNVGHWCAILRNCPVKRRSPEGGTRARDESQKIGLKTAPGSISGPLNHRKGLFCAPQLHMTSSMLSCIIFEPPIPFSLRSFVATAPLRPRCKKGPFAAPHLALLALGALFRISNASSADLL